MKHLILIVTAVMAAGVLAAEKKGGRAAVGKFEVPADVHYDVKSYREGPHPRAGQVGIAVAKKHLENPSVKLPVVIFVHGGGWRQGDKDQLTWRCFQYAQQGYVAVTVSYRLVDEAPFPACIFDVMEAVRFVKSLAGEFPIDPDNVGLYGYSAGAHLVLMAALAGDVDDFNSGAYGDEDCSVKCVVAVASPVDFTSRRKREGPLKMMSKQQNENGSFLARTSPIHYIHKNQPPILMLHGTADTLVPSYQYLNFQKRCEEVGVSNFELVTDPGGGHMFIFKNQKTYQPTIEAYFDKWLN